MENPDSKEGECESTSMEIEKEVTSAPACTSEPLGQELPINATTSTLEMNAATSSSSTLPSSSRSVIVSSDPATMGGSLTHASHPAALPKPPPLISTSNLIASVPSSSSSVKDPVEPSSTQAVNSVGINNQSTSVIKLEGDSNSSQKVPSAGPSLSVGLGAGKLKAFISMLGGSTPKKQSTKKASGGVGTGGRGQGGRSKPSPLSSGASSRKVGGDLAPSRSSNRNIKRPRTYDEEMDELKTMKALFAKKAKAAPKSSKTGMKKHTSVMASTGVKDLSRWRPTDDLMLISAIQQTNDLSVVHLGVNFSCRFTMQEVEERWYALLYNLNASQLAIEAMQGLHPGVVTMALNNALWSQEEEAVLARIPPTDPGHLEKFQSVLRDNPAVFHTCRTATSLHHHWVLMGHNNLLNTQKVDLVPPVDNVKEFVDVEDHLDDSELMKHQDVKEQALEQELMVADRHAKMEIMKLEEELPLWRTALDTGSPLEFGPNDYALFKGNVVEFRMSKRTVFFGRATSNNSVDFDLSLEAPAFKISRRQAMVQLTDSGEFMLHNEGKRPIYVSSTVLLPRTCMKLQHNQILEIMSMAFLISLNTKLASLVKGSTT